MAFIIRIIPVDYFYSHMSNLKYIKDKEFIVMFYYYEKNWRLCVGTDIMFE